MKTQNQKLKQYNKKAIELLLESDLISNNPNPSHPSLRYCINYEFNLELLEPGHALSKGNYIDMVIEKLNWIKQNTLDTDIYKLEEIKNNLNENNINK